MAITPSLRPQAGRPGPHPAISLAVGFGVIILGALIVHLVFHSLV